MIGLSPRNAANSVDTGGTCAIRLAEAAGTPCAVSPAVTRGRQVRGEAYDQQREEDPDREDHRGVLERRADPGAGAALSGLQAVHDAGPVGRREQAHPDSVEQQQERELEVREVDR